MREKLCKALQFFGFTLCFVWLLTWTVQAGEIAVETSTTLYAKIDKTLAVTDIPKTDGTVLFQAGADSACEVMEPEKDGWLKIKAPEGEGYVPANLVTLLEKTQEKVDQSAKQRQEIVDYALQFLGGRYVYGGLNPNSGVDCSGFTSYVLKQAAGVDLSHSSRAQAGEGRRVSYENARPGDLVFYAKNGHINHVALYMGNDRVIHASSPKTGIVVSNVTYRSPVKFVSFLNE